MKGLGGTLVLIWLTVLKWGSGDEEDITIIMPPTADDTNIEIENIAFPVDPWIPSDNHTKVIEDLLSGRPLEYFAGNIYDELKKQFVFCDFLTHSETEVTHVRKYVPAVCIKQEDCTHPEPFELSLWGTKGCQDAAKRLSVYSAILPEGHGDSFVCCPINGTKEWKAFVQRGYYDEPGPSQLELSEIPPSLQLQEPLSSFKHLPYFTVTGRNYDNLKRSDKVALLKFFDEGHYKKLSPAGRVCGFARKLPSDFNKAGKTIYQWYPYLCVEPHECQEGSPGTEPNPLWNQFCQSAPETVCCHINRTGEKFLPASSGGYVATAQIPTFFRYALGLRSAYKCEEYATRVCNRGLCQDQTAIPPIPGEFPHLASLGTIYKHLILFQCGGTLISLRYIISSASCRKYLGYKVNIAMLGETITATYDKGKEKYYVINEIKNVFGVPPEFRPRPWQTENRSRSDEIDIALYKTAVEVEFTRYIRPACIWHGFREWDTQHPIYDFVGFGSEIGYRRDRMRLLTFLKDYTTLHHPWCTTEDFQRDKIENPLYGRYGASNDWLVCMRDHNHDLTERFEGRDLRYQDANPCKVDRGGPLTVTYPYCSHLLFGVLSSNNYCRDRHEIPSVFVKIDSILGAIEDEVWGDHLFLDLEGVKFQKLSCGNTKDYFFFNKCADGYDCYE